MCIRDRTYAVARERLYVKAWIQFNGISWDVARPGGTPDWHDTLEGAHDRALAIAVAASQVMKAQHDWEEAQGWQEAEARAKRAMSTLVERLRAEGGA